MTVQKGYFEVAKFHGIDVAIFDSHWFANKIVETDGLRYMCCQVEREALAALPYGEHYVNLQSCRAAMAPYRDFMAAHKRSSNRGCYLGAMNGDYYLWVMFTVDPGEEDTFRLETAQKMLDAEPIRYCIPIDITPL